MTATNKLRAYHLFIILMIAALTACSSDSDSSDPDEKTGSLTFAINWDTEPEEEAGEQSAARKLETVHQSSVDCAGRGISSIRATLYDSKNEEIAQEEWPCDNHGGIIKGVPAPQSGVSIVLAAKDDNGNISYRGEEGDLTIEIGPNNNAGAIDVFRFIPSPPEPTGESNTITWNPVQGAAQYRLAFSATGDSGSPADRYSTDTQFTATTLAPETQYTVRVFARDSHDNESGGSQEGQLTTIGLSAVPQNITAEEKMYEITLNWEGEAGTLYNVYWSTTPGITKTNYAENGGKFEDIAEPTFTHSSLEGNTVYYYVVTSENSVGQESDLSAEISATAVGDPLTPADLKAEGGDRKVTLSWTAAPGFVYNIYWSNEPGVSKTNHAAVVENIEGNTYVHGDCDSTLKHYYVITAENEVTESPPSGEVSASPGWIELFEHGVHNSNAVDTAGNHYIAGWTRTPIADQNTIGEGDMALVKYNPHGEFEWARIFGSKGSDRARDVVTDREGNVYVAGCTLATDGWEVFVDKFDANGKPEWTREFPEYTVREDSLAIAVDPEGYSYITGTIPENEENGEGAFIAKYGPKVEDENTKNEPDWTHILRSEPKHSDSETRSIALDGQGGVYITGHTYGHFADTSLNGWCDIFVAKYSEKGEGPLWVTQLGGEYSDEGTTIAANQNACFVAGYWNRDLYIAKLNADDGAFQWGNNVKTGQSYLFAKSIALTPNGNLIVGTGTRLAVFEDHTNRGEPDSEGVYPYEMLILAYDTEGVRLWYELPGTPEDDFLEALTIDDAGYAYITGSTRGNFGGHINLGEDRSSFTWKRFLGQ